MKMNKTAKAICIGGRISIFDENGQIWRVVESAEELGAWAVKNNVTVLNAADFGLTVYPDGVFSVSRPGEAQEPSEPVDDGSCDPLYGQRMDDADLGRN